MGRRESVFRHLAALTQSHRLHPERYGAAGCSALSAQLCSSSGSWPRPSSPNARSNQAHCISAASQASIAAAPWPRPDFREVIASPPCCGPARARRAYPRALPRPGVGWWGGAEGGWPGHQADRLGSAWKSTADGPTKGPTAARVKQAVGRSQRRSRAGLAGLAGFAGLAGLAYSS